jgi:hypothetical protein
VARRDPGGTATLQRYRQLVDNQIKPHIGGAILQELSTAGVKAWHKTLRERGRKQRKAGEEAPRRSRTAPSCTPTAASPTRWVTPWRSG